MSLFVVVLIIKFITINNQRFFNKKEIILLGDTYCDLGIKTADQPIENDFRHIYDLNELFSFKQLIQEPTRVILTTFLLTDHIAMTCLDNIVSSGVLSSYYE